MAVRSRVATVEMRRSKEIQEPFRRQNSHLCYVPSLMETAGKLLPDLTSFLSRVYCQNGTSISTTLCALLF
jgi:hypothetical protein